VELRIRQSRSEDVKTSILCAKSTAIDDRYESNRETYHLYRSKKKKGRRFRQACHKIKPSKKIIYGEPVCYKREEKGWPTKKISMMISTPSSGTAALPQQTTEPASLKMDSNHLKTSCLYQRRT
jgi:hypothetical protein